MTAELFTPRALRELREAARRIAEANPEAAEAMLRAAVEAARRIAANPGLARNRLELAPARYRFWSLRGFPYLLVLDAERHPPVVARFVHQARDLPAAIREPEA